MKRVPQIAKDSAHKSRNTTLRAELAKYCFDHSVEGWMKLQKERGRAIGLETLAWQSPTER